MVLNTNHVSLANSTAFVPELWSDEVVAAYKANLVLANLVRNLNHRGKKGDTIHIPTPARGVASDVSSPNTVTLIEGAGTTDIVVLIDKHKEYSRLMEDIVETQALESLRRFYTDDAGYAISTSIDTDIIREMANAGWGTLVFDGTTGAIDSTSVPSTAVNGNNVAFDETNAAAITDTGIRGFIKTLDDSDAPMAGRAMVIPTVVKQDLLGLARFTEQAFVGEVGPGNSIRNGLVGDTYGIEVYVTTQMPLVENDGGTPDGVLGQVFQRDASLLVEQLGVRVQTQYKQEYLADLLTADSVYGVKNLRDASIINFVALA